MSKYHILFEMFTLGSDTGNTLVFSSYGRNDTSVYE